MLSLEVPPCPALRRYVKCYWTLQSPEPIVTPRLHHVLPDNCTDILFRLDGATRPHLVGMMTRAITVPLVGNVHYVAVRFRAGGARRFVAPPLGELTDGSADLPALWGAGPARELEERLGEAPDTRARFELLERELLSRLERYRGPVDSLALRAAELAERAGGAIPVARLAAAFSVSRQHLAREFEREIGLSPKLFCRLARFHRLWGTVSGESSVSWVERALELGYYDQAHLISDFREFAGSSPEAYLKASHRTLPAAAG